MITAYDGRCAMCELRHPSLLDGAHIVPDGHPDGLAITANGLSLCKIHHAAYDQRFIGVRPDMVIEVDDDLLHEVDGPMLRHGLQDLHRERLRVLPRRRVDRPDPIRLEWRYTQFRERRDA
ncbi:HNH endonuclease [Euzebya sp.]|uniref:HNH endonuclease n=1 Tax=Euzebya sp. TaxID=1971409 RepID=UPI00355A440F